MDDRSQTTVQIAALTPDQTAHIKHAQQSVIGEGDPRLSRVVGGSTPQLWLRYRRHGALRFLRVWRLNLSWSWSRGKA